MWRAGGPWLYPPKDTAVLTEMLHAHTCNLHMIPTLFSLCQRLKKAKPESTRLPAQLGERQLGLLAVPRVGTREVFSPGVTVLRFASLLARRPPASAALITPKRIFALQLWEVFVLVKNKPSSLFCPQQFSRSGIEKGTENAEQDRLKVLHTRRAGLRGKGARRSVKSTSAVNTEFPTKLPP